MDRDVGQRVDALAVVAVDHPLVNEAVEDIAGRGKPVFIRNRTKDEIAKAVATPLNELADRTAGSITPICTSLPSSSFRRLMGTRELRHSTETWSMRLLAKAGKNFSYCRHSVPSDDFHSTFAGMP